MRNGYKLFLGIVIGLLLIISLGFNCYILLNSNKCKDTNCECQKCDETTQNNTSNLYNNIEMDKKTLDKLYYIIGVLPESNEELLNQRHCLNVAVTNTNYIGIPYVQDVFSWYVMTYGKEASYDKYKDANYKVDNNEISAYNCAGCFTIKKSEVEEFKKLYYFGPETKYDFIYEIDNYNDIYGAVHSLGSPVECTYNVNHNIIEASVEKGTEGETIYLTDEQVVTKYDNTDHDSISQFTKQTINYSFYKKNNSDTYQLSDVFHRNKVK